MCCVAAGGDAAGGCVGLPRRCEEPRDPRLARSRHAACNSCSSRSRASLLAGELTRWLIGRGRPFVGGQANAFNFAPLAGTEAYASLPSGPRHHRLRAGLRGGGGLAAGAGRDGGLCRR